jgi:hypothetical protein
LQDLVVEMGRSRSRFTASSARRGQLPQLVGESISGLIIRTMDGRRAAEYWLSVVQSIIQSFATWAAAWNTKQLIMFALGQKLKTADSATTAARRCRRGGDGPAAPRRPSRLRAAAAIGLALVLARWRSSAASRRRLDGRGRKLTPGIVHAGEDVFTIDYRALGRGSEGLKNVELLRRVGPAALPTVANRRGVARDDGQLRLNRPGSHLAESSAAVWRWRTFRRSRGSKVDAAAWKSGASRVHFHTSEPRTKS